MQYVSVCVILVVRNFWQDMIFCQLHNLKGRGGESQRQKWIEKWMSYPKWNILLFYSLVVIFVLVLFLWIRPLININHTIIISSIHPQSYKAVVEGEMNLLQNLLTFLPSAITPLKWHGLIRKFLLKPNQFIKTCL